MPDQDPKKPAENDETKEPPTLPEVPKDFQTEPFYVEGQEQGYLL